MKKEKLNFKPHKMYCKDGSVKDATTYNLHLKYKKMGCGHSPKKNKKNACPFCGGYCGLC